MFSNRELQQAVEVLEALIHRAFTEEAMLWTCCFRVDSYCGVHYPFQKEEVSSVKIILSARVGGTTKKQNWSDRAAFQDIGEKFLTHKLGPSS